MTKHSLSGRLISGAITLLVLVGLLAGMIYFHASSGTDAAGVAPQMIPSNVVSTNPQLLYAGNLLPDGQFACQKPGASPRCYTPQQIRTAYNVQPLLKQGLTGQGHTIVLIDAFQSPTIVNDLHQEDKLFGLPNPTLNIIAPQGLTKFNPNNPNQVGWSAEITIDVEWAHVIAPGATIDLMLAKNSQDANLLAVTQYAIEHNLGDVISQSFGEAEKCATNLVQEHKVYQEAISRHITLFASTGDYGAAQYTCHGGSFLLSASTPATDPLVTAVGGTYLNANTKTGQYIGEAVWNDSSGASGGGFSTVYASPNYQQGVPGIGKARGVPDVSYNADGNSGGLTVWSESGQGKNLVFIYSGTSAGSPQWAAITVLADQYNGHRLSFINAGIYRIGMSDFYSQVFHDTRVGTNTFTGTGSNGKPVTINGYNARVGWDACTGWGTPNAYNFVHIIGGYVHANDGQGF